MKVFLIFLSVFLPAYGNDFVRNDGFQQWVNGQIGGEGQCQSASAREYLELVGDCPRLDAAETLEERLEFFRELQPLADNLSEEYIFTDLTRRSHAGTQCLLSILEPMESQETPSESRVAIVERLNAIWAGIEPKIERINEEIEEIKREGSRDIHATGISRAEASAMRHPIIKRSGDRFDRIAKLKYLRGLLIDTLPYASEPSLKEAYMKKAKGKHLNITGLGFGETPPIEEYFQEGLENSLRKARNRNRDLYRSMIGEDGERVSRAEANAEPELRGNEVYRVKNKDKEQLTQVFHSSLTEQYQDSPLVLEGAVCRNYSRYVSGPKRINNAIDGVLIGASVVTFGGGGVLSALSRTAMSGAASFASARRIVGVATAGLFVAGTARMANIAYSSCYDAANAPTYSDSACSEGADPVIFERTRSSMSKCAFDIALSSLAVAPFINPFGRVRSLAGGNQTVNYNQTTAQLQGALVEPSRFIQTTGGARMRFGTTQEFLSNPAIPQAAKDRVARIAESSMAMDMGETGARVSNRFEALSYIAEPNLRRGFARAIDEMHSPAAWARYNQQLAADTLEYQLRSGVPELVEAARQGNITRDAMVRVLEHRAASRGIGRVTVQQGVDPITFNQFIGRGTIYSDEAFSITSAGGHGRYTHLIQTDFAYPIIQRTSGTQSYEDIVEYLGTRAGLRTWDAMFDAQNATPMSPEFLTRQFPRAIDLPGGI